MEPLSIFAEIAGYHNFPHPARLCTIYIYIIGIPIISCIYGHPYYIIDGTTITTEVKE